MRGQQERLQREVALCTVPIGPVVTFRRSRGVKKLDRDTMERKWREKCQTRAVVKKLPSLPLHRRTAFVKKELSEFTLERERREILLRQERRERWIAERSAEIEEEVFTTTVRNALRMPAGLREVVMSGWAMQGGNERILTAIRQRLAAGEGTRPTDAQWAHNLLG